MFSLHFIFLNHSDGISVALHFKIRICADIFLMHLKSCFRTVLQRMCWYDRINTDDTKANVMNQSLNLKENKEKPGLNMWVKKEG